MNNDFGMYIRKLRRDRNFSLKQFASEVGITPYYLSYIENGKKKNPNVKIMIKMFRVLKLEKSEIERFLDLHAKVNGIVSYDIVDFIMKHDEIRALIRSERDKPDNYPNWDDFINNFINM